jgi:hypothetical protein
MDLFHIFITSKIIEKKLLSDLKFIQASNYSKDKNSFKDGYCNGYVKGFYYKLYPIFFIGFSVGLLIAGLIMLTLGYD